MTGPRVFSGVYDDTSSITKPNEPRAFSGIYDATPQKPLDTANAQGFLNYTKNLLVRGTKAYMFTKGQIDITDPDMAAMIAAANDPMQKQKMADFGSLFGGIVKDIPNQVVAAAKQIGEQGLSMRDLPTFTGQFLKGMEKPIGDLLELSSGIQFTADDIRALTPEEKTSRMKNVVATTVMLVVAKASYSAVGALSGLEGAGGVVAASEGATGSLAKRMLANAAVGTAAGASYGLVEGMGDDDQLTKIIADGIFGAGLSTAFGLTFGGQGKEIVKGIRGKKASSVKIQDAIDASNISQIRSVQSPDNTIGDNLRMASAFQTADDVAQAVVLGKIKPDGITRVSGIDPSKISIMGEDVPSDFRTAIHMRADGLADLLVHDSKLGVDERFFEKNGFVRGQTVSLGGDTNWHVADANGDNVILENKNDALDRWVAKRDDVRHPSGVEINTPKTFDTENANTKIYTEWKSDLAAKLKIENGKPILNAPLPGDFSVLSHMNDFIESKQLTPSQHKALAFDIQHRMIAEVSPELEPAERDIIANVRKDRAATNPKLVTREWESLRRNARSNGMDITDGGSGRVIVRSLEKGRSILKGFNSREDAATWINKTGQADGPQLDDNGTLDTSIAGGGNNIPPESGTPVYPQDGPYKYFSHNSKGLQRLVEWVNSKPFITRYRDYFLNLDGKYNTKLHRDILEPINNTRNIRNAQIKPFVEAFTKIQKAAKLTTEQAERVHEYMQTMSPDEVRDNFLNRRMNPMEEALAQRIASSNVDLERVFTYRHELSKLHEDFPVEVRESGAHADEYDQKLATLKDAFAIDEPHTKIAELFDTIEGMNPNDISHGAIVRLARSMNNGAGDREMSQSEFAVTHKMTPSQLYASNALKQLYDVINTKFGLDRNTSLNEFMTHAKLFTDGDLARAIKQFPDGGTNAKKYYERMIYSGEISAYETDPFRALMRYMKSGFDVHSGFYDAIQKSQESLKENTKMLPDNLQELAKDVTNRYINDVRGFPEAGDKAAQEAVDYMMDQFKLGSDINVRRNLVGGVSSLINLSALGLRPMLGISHFGISTILSIAARSHSYTARMLANAGRAIGDKAILDDLHSSGVFQGISPFSTIKADYFDNPKMSKVGSTIDKIQEVAFKATLLPTIYEGMAAGHYITASQDAIGALTEYGREIVGKKPEEIVQAWNKVQKKTFLNRYDQPVIDRFTDLAKSNPSDAAHYLGQQAVEDLVGTYGSGSSPYMWGTNIGRVAGQFGSFAMWIRGTMQRMASRGTIADRATSIAKVTALSYGVVKAGDELGIDLTRMSPYHAMTWLFGPLIKTAEDVATAMHSTGYQQKEAQRRLMRTLPLDEKGNFHPSIFIPMSFAIDGLVKAADDWSKGHEGLAAVEAIGFHKTQQPTTPQF